MPGDSHIDMVGRYRPGQRDAVDIMKSDDPTNQDKKYDLRLFDVDVHFKDGSGEETKLTISMAQD